jgi:hypothetical protein
VDDVVLYALVEALSDLQLHNQGGGDRWMMLFSKHWWRPYQTCSYIIRVVFSLIMSSSAGGLSRPPAVRQNLARTP